MKKFYYYIIIAGLILAASGWFILARQDRTLRQMTPYDEMEQEEVILQITGTMYYVSPQGDDNRDGKTQETALASIQQGVALLEPGDGLTLLDGRYLQDFVTVRDGTVEKKINILGSKKAVLSGTGKQARIVSIQHSHIILSGFTIDGLVGGAKEKENYRDKLIYVEGRTERVGVEGVRLMHLALKNAGGECVRIKYFSQKNEIAYNHITGCGAYDFILGGGGKNGEGIYIGTAPEQVAKDKNVTRDIDQSNANWVHDNVINTQGNECIDIKEGSSFNVVERNVCTGQKDKESAGLDSRGNNNIFRQNEVFGCAGAGVRLGGDEDEDGINNDVMENNLHDNAAGGIKIQNQPQGKICGNKIVNNKKGTLVGEYGEDMKNEKTCRYTGGIFTRYGIR